MIRSTLLLPLLALATAASAQTPQAADVEAVLGGTRQVVNVRGADRGNPILVFVHGGPGAVEMPVAWSFQRPWEDFFTGVQWDQRGAGRSFPLNDTAALAPTLNVERYRDDTVELIELLGRRYGSARCSCWGTAGGRSSVSPSRRTVPTSCTPTSAWAR